MGLTQRYTDILAEHGMDLQDVFYIDDIALDREMTLRAIDILEEEGAVILGGDVYLMANGKLRFALANWYTNRRPDEHTGETARRSVAHSRTYVTQFKDASGDVPYFSLVIDQGL